MSKSQASPHCVKPKFEERKLNVVLIDIVGYVRVLKDFDDVGKAQFFHEYYCICHEVFDAAGGTIIKFMGDSCLATFENGKSVEAVNAAQSLSERFAEICKHHGIKTDLACNIHLGKVAWGKFGPEQNARIDILGAGVNHAFLLGNGAGIRISEPVFRQLPNNLRGQWDKKKLPVTYELKS